MKIGPATAGSAGIGVSKERRDKMLVALGKISVFLSRWVFVLIVGVAALLTFPYMRGVSGFALGAFFVFLALELTPLLNIWEMSAQKLSPQLGERLKEATSAERKALANVAAILGVVVVFSSPVLLGVAGGVLLDNFLLGLLSLPSFVAGLIIVAFGGAIRNLNALTTERPEES